MSAHVRKKKSPFDLPRVSLVMMNRKEAYIFDREKNEEITKDVASIVDIDADHYAVTFRSGKSYHYKKDEILRSANLRLIRIKTAQVDAEEKIKDALKHQT